MGRSVLTRRHLSSLAIVLCVFSKPAPILGDQPPGMIIDLSSWRLTLPVDTERPGSPDEIRKPELATFSDNRYFFVNQDVNGIVFRAHCGGSTTRGSSFPRCELRETVAGGKKRAAWDTDGNTINRMTLRAAITKTPSVKRHVVCAQIHDADDDIIMIRLEGKKLFIERNKVGDVMLERNYKLGTPFEIRTEAGKGRIRVWYNGESKMNWSVSRQGCYFKAGCYTQSNTQKGDHASSYGEVVIFSLQTNRRTN